MDLIKNKLNSKIYSLVGLIFSVYTIFLSRTCPHHSAGRTCISPHIVDNWLGTYNNGFVRNGLLGHLHSIFIGNQVNLVWLNLLGFGLIALNLIFIYRSFLKKSIVPYSQILFLFILITPLFSVFINTIGHSIHFCLIVFSLTLLSIRYLQKKTHQIILILISIFLMGFIHESSIILISPAFVTIFLNPFSKQFFKKGLFLILLYYLILFGFVITTNYHNYDFSNVENLIAFNPLDERTHTPVPFRNLAFSISQEFKIIYGSKEIFIKNFFFKAITASLFPFLISIMIGITKINYLETVRFFKLLLLTWLYSMPFYLTNNLWGAIAILNIVTTLFIYETSSILFEAKNYDLKKINTLYIFWKFIEDNNLKVLILLAFLILFLYPVNAQTWLRGVPESNALMFIPLLLVIFFYFKNKFTKYLRNSKGSYSNINN